jgi:hypothetical protein
VAAHVFWGKVFMIRALVPVIALLAVGCSQPAATPEAPAAEAAADAAPAADTAAATAPAGLDLAAFAAGTWTGMGTEPFWELKVAPGQALNVTVQGESFDATGPYAAPTAGEGGAQIITTGNLVVTLTAETCILAEGTNLPVTVSIVVDGNAEGTMNGCAESAEHPRVETP